jgi:hypothetical protein
LGLTVTTYDGDSEIHVRADEQIRFGRNVRAGKVIDIRGGVDPEEDGVPYSGNGVVLYGSTQMQTWRPGSEINLSAAGQVSILTPEYTQQLRAASFIQRASGRISGDVELSLWLSRVDFDVTAMVTLPATATTDNTAIQHLVQDLQQALNNAVWTIVRSDNPNYEVGQSWQFESSENPDLVVSLSESRLMLSGAWKHEIRPDSIHADRLGWTELTNGALKSSVPYALNASLPGSVVRIGAADGSSGKLYLAGKIIAHSAIELYSGAAQASAAGDMVFVELDSTGVLETVNGSITLSPGARTVLYGSVIAGGPTSDVVVSAEELIELRGSLTAGRSILVEAGSAIVPDAESIRTYGTSTLKSLYGGEIRLRGVNDVVINSTIGAGSENLSLIELSSSAGNLLIDKQAGRIETGTQLNFSGHSVEIAGVVSSTRATPQADDFEVRIDITGTALLHGDLQFAGSMLVKAGDIEVYDQKLVVRGVSQKLRFEALDSIAFSRTEQGAEGLSQQGAHQSHRVLKSLPADN